MSDIIKRLGRIERALGLDEGTANYSPVTFSLRDEDIEFLREETFRLRKASRSETLRLIIEGYQAGRSR